LCELQGAPEKIISMCKTILVQDKEYEIDDEWKLAFNLVYHTLGTYGERVLGFCDCRLPSDRFPVGYEFDAENPDFLDVGFRFVGLISMIDPPKASKKQENGYKIA
jgi:sodium/potassium-transporting ATPase subunit alpha